MITAYDNKPNDDAAVVLTTVNCDGIKRYWTADSIEEFHRWWWDEEYGGPASDDEVVELIVDGNKINGIEEYYDIVEKYNFDEEVEVGILEINYVRGALEYVPDSLLI